MKKILKNSIYAFCIILYLFVLSFAYTRMNIERLTEDIKVFSGMFLILGLLSLERAYKQDSGKIAIIGIELLFFAFHSLSIMHMIALLKCDFIPYVLISAGVVGIYYILKIIVIYTKQRKNTLKNLSDISEIVKKDEPVKKEAKKTSERKEELRIKQKEEKEEKAKKEKSEKKTKNTKKQTKNKKQPKVKSESVNKKEKNKQENDEKIDTKKENNKGRKNSTKKKNNTKTKKEVNKND